MTGESDDVGHDDELVARVLTMREAGRPWKEIAEACGVTRQQARYAYQLGKRQERRSARRSVN